MQILGEKVTDIAVVISDLRKNIVEGLCIDLVPYDASHADAVVRLRNLPHVRYFLNQERESDLANQAAWHEGYLKRTDDIFWVLRSKAGDIVGCNRLYDITPEQLEKGSLIVDPDFSRILPVALEADLLALRCAFETIGVETVVTRVRDDNVKMQSVNTRLGFHKIDVEDIRGVPYPIFSLSKGAYRPEGLQAVVNQWSKRNEHRSA